MPIAFESKLLFTIWSYRRKNQSTDFYRSKWNRGCHHSGLDDKCKDLEKITCKYLLNDLYDTIMG